MPRKCSICAHPRWPEIQAVHRGGATYPAIVSEFGVSLGSLSRHFNNPVCQRRWEAVDEPQAAVETLQAAAGVQVRMTACGASVAISAPAIRTRERLSPAPLPSRPVQPVAPSRTSNVVHLRRSEQIAADPTVSEQEPSLQHLAKLMSLGYTSGQIAEQLGWGPEKMASAIARVDQAKRAILDKSREDWGAYFVYSAMDRLAGYRRKRDAAEVGLRHREAERYETMIAAGDRDLFTMLERLGRLGPLDPASLGAGSSPAEEIQRALLNCMNGTFEPTDPQDRPEPLIR